MDVVGCTYQLRATTRCTGVRRPDNKHPGSPRSGAATNPSPQGAAAMTPVLCPENRRCAVDADVRLGGWWGQALLFWLEEFRTDNCSVGRRGIRLSFGISALRHLPTCLVNWDAPLAVNAATSCPPASPFEHGGESFPGQVQGIRTM